MLVGQAHFELCVLPDTHESERMLLELLPRSGQLGTGF